MFTGSQEIVGARYTIEHIKGKDSVWADLVSRLGPTWSVKPSEGLAVKRVVSDPRGEVVDQGSAGNTGDEEVNASSVFSRVDLPGAHHQLPLTSAAVENLANVRRVTTRSERPVSTLHPLQDDKFLWPSVGAVGAE
ncbi:hypothetical protein GN958_ATG00269 [Phytophthora infestans]|uniref:Uncharacterized protein n=1 Tax=Phytophthora infestans TaxID=4787 RepID=A0A8S9VEJ8_PHYIN|nr:hypothetical protein GN958_ATG00269 [Phytophthora infestans]